MCEVENSMKSFWVVAILLCAMATIAALVNGAPTATADALTPPSSRRFRRPLRMKAARKTVMRLHLRLAFGL
jgi:hypothetical protein